MRRRLLIMMITAVLVFACGIITVNAETSGECGDNATWVLNDNGVLTISGSGEMYGYDPFEDERDSPFSGNEEIKSIVIQDGITSIGADAFSDCSCLKTITIPGSVKTIGARAFEGCSNLEAVTIPEGVTTIGKDFSVGAFYGCSSLTTVTIPGSVTYMGETSFCDCEKLESINVDESNAYYASKEGILYNKDFTRLISCPGGKTSATIEESVTIIGEDAFETCSKLTSIVIPSNVVEIQTAAFAICEGLRTVTIPGSVSVISKNAFTGCTNLEEVYISDGVETIGDGAFKFCGKLGDVVLPASIKSIGADAFGRCDNMQKIEINRANENYCSIDGVVYNKNKSELVLCPSGKNSVTIPDTVTTIGVSAFIGNSKIEKVIIPPNVKHIEELAFSNCYNLKKITIPESVTTLGEAAFQECSSLTSVRILGNIATIPRLSFSFCNNLTSVSIPASVITIEYDAFYDSDQISDIYYAGTASQWNNINGISEFDGCSDVRMHYESVEPDSDDTHEHQWNSVYTIDKPASCTEEGRESIHCKECNEIKAGSSRTIPKIAHSYNAWKTTKKATEDTAGVSTRICSVCGNKETKTIAQLAPSLKVATKISKPVAAKGAVTVRWKKQTAKNQKKITGYQIQIATDKSFTKNVKTVKTSKKATSKKIRKLKKKTKYYIRVRTYKGQKRGRWSSVKAIKTK